MMKELAERIKENRSKRDLEYQVTFQVKCKWCRYIPTCCEHCGGWHSVHKATTTLTVQQLSKFILATRGYGEKETKDLFSNIINIKVN